VEQQRREFVSPPTYRLAGGRFATFESLGDLAISEVFSEPQKHGFGLSRGEGGDCCKNFIFLLLADQLCRAVPLCVYELFGKRVSSLVSFSLASLSERVMSGVETDSEDTCSRVLVLSNVIQAVPDVA
jgi:hypothetical protein